MEKVYNVHVNVEWQFDIMEIKTEWKPTNLFKTKDGAKNHMENLFYKFKQEFPKLNNAITESHACVWESRPYADSYEPLEIRINIEELDLND